jgi:hypothetical protein
MAENLTTKSLFKVIVQRVVSELFRDFTLPASGAIEANVSRHERLNIYVVVLLTHDRDIFCEFKRRRNQLVEMFEYYLDPFSLEVSTRSVSIGDYQPNRTQGVVDGFITTNETEYICFSSEDTSCACPSSLMRSE